jgi:hypothetical protein
MPGTLVLNSQFVTKCNSGFRRLIGCIYKEKAQGEPWASKTCNRCCALP